MIFCSGGYKQLNGLQNVLPGVFVGIENAKRAGCHPRSRRECPKNFLMLHTQNPVRWHLRNLGI